MGYSPVLGDCESKPDFAVIMFLTKFVAIFIPLTILLNVSSIYNVVIE